MVVVAGRDPYAHRGYADRAVPLLRRDGRSGCVSWVSGTKLPYADEPVATTANHDE